MMSNYRNISRALGLILPTLALLSVAVLTLPARTAYGADQPSPAHQPSGVFQTGPLTYTIQAGDTPLILAVRFGTDVDSLMAVNQIDDPTALQIGQVLIIPVGATSPPTFQPDRPLTVEATTTAQLTSTTHITHVIAAGEIPLSIAAQYDVSVELLMRVNGIVDPSALQVGQRVVIPNSTDLAGVALNTQVTRHTIRAGDTFLQLSGRYGTTLEEIIAANSGLDPTNLQVGQEIIIPTNATASTIPDVPVQPSLDELLNQPLPIQVQIPTSANAELLKLQTDMIAAINTQRQIYGLPDYVVDEGLNELAMARAQDMDTRGYFSHWTPEGKNSNALAQEQGLNVGRVTENIQRNVYPVNETVDHAITWFMGDPPHRQNILHPQRAVVGVGVSNINHFYTFVMLVAEEK